MIRIFFSLILMVFHHVHAQDGPSATTQPPQAIVSTPDTEFLLSREFDRLSKRIEDLETWRNQFRRDRNQINEMFQGKSQDESNPASSRQIVVEITKILKSMNDEKYWSANPQELSKKFLGDVSNLEQLADRLLGLRSNTTIRQVRSLITRRINDTKDTRMLGMLDVYLSP